MPDSPFQNVDVGALLVRCERAEAERNRLYQELAFYAEERAWEGIGVVSTPATSEAFALVADAGTRARQACGIVKRPPAPPSPKPLPRETPPPAPAPKAVPPDLHKAAQDAQEKRPVVPVPSATPTDDAAD